MGGVETSGPAADRGAVRGAGAVAVAMGAKADPGPRVCGLASARDRARLRERQAAERARVEQVLARGPIGLEIDDEWRPAAPARSLVGSAHRVAGSPVPSRDAGCLCHVCGGGEVDVDFVRDRGTWRLARCGRCDFIWTELAMPRRATGP